MVIIGLPFPFVSPFIVEARIDDEELQIGLPFLQS